VIEQGKIDCLGRTSKPSRGVAIVPARTAISTGVIVGQYDAGAAKPCCIDDDIPHWKGHRSGIAVIAFEMDTASAVVDVGNPKSLH
jgi:hypothetical protein